MNKLIKVFLFAAFLLPLYATTGAADTLTIAVGDFCPYQCLPEKEDGKIGFMSELTRAIYAKAGHSVNFEFVPFGRAIAETEQGKYAAMVCNPGHSDKLLFSEETVGVLRQQFFVKKGSPWVYTGIDSLESIIIGSVIGYNLSIVSPEYEAYIQEHKGTPRVQHITANDCILRNAKKILSGRITTYNEDVGLFNYATAKAGIMDEFVTVGSIGDNYLYMAFDPANPNAQKYRNIYDRGIRELRESGELAQILAPYGVTDWEE